MFPAKSTGFHGDSTGPPRVHLTKSHWCHKLPVKGDKVLEKTWSMIFQKYSKQFDASTALAEIFKSTSAWSQTHAKQDTVPSCWCHNIYEVYSCIYWQLLAISWFFLDDGASKDLAQGMEGYQIILRWTTYIIKISKSAILGKHDVCRKTRCFHIGAAKIQICRF